MTHTLSLGTVVFRLSLAVLCGGILGQERERRGRPAGLRTYILVCLGATLTMLLGQYYVVAAEQLWAGAAVQTDVTRLSAQVINGVGFLGAGTVLTTSRQKTKGLTTAACLWASACMGIAIGAGFYAGVLFGCGAIALSMWVLPAFEEGLRSRSRSMELLLGLDRLEGIEQVLESLKNQNVTVYDLDMMEPELPGQGRYRVSLRIGMASAREREAVFCALSRLPWIRTLEEGK